MVHCQVGPSRATGEVAGKNLSLSHGDERGYEQAGYNQRTCRLVCTSAGISFPETKAARGFMFELRTHHLNPSTTSQPRDQRIPAKVELNDGPLGVLGQIADRAVQA